MPPSELPRQTKPQVHQIDMEATVNITVNDREPIERVTGPNGDEWRVQMYPLNTEFEVLAHWASNALRHGITDVCELDGWSDVQAETVTFEVVGVEAM